MSLYAQLSNNEDLEQILDRISCEIDKIKLSFTGSPAEKRDQIKLFFTKLIDIYIESLGIDPMVNIAISIYKNI